MKNTIKNSLIAACVIGAALLGACDPIRSTSADGVESWNDTLRLVEVRVTFVRADTIVYAYRDPDGGKVRVTTIAPPVLDTALAPVEWAAAATAPGQTGWSSEGRAILYDTLGALPKSRDPVVVKTSRDTTIMRYDTVWVPLDSLRLAAFSKSCRPEIRDSAAFRSFLAAPVEGYEYRTPVPAYGYPGDSTGVELSGNPGFIDLVQTTEKQRSVLDAYNDGAPIDPAVPVPVLTDAKPLYRYLLRVRPAHAQRDSAYRFAVVVRNRFGGAESVWVDMRVKPYDRVISSRSFGQALVEAAMWADRKALDSLYGYPVAPGIRGDGGKTPLMGAATTSDSANLRFLLEHGVPLDAVDAAGKNALAYAIAENKQPSARFLVMQGIDCSKLDDDSFQRLLDLLINAGDLEGLQAVAKTRDLAKEADSRQTTVLIKASRAGQVPMVAWLLAAGAEVNHKNLIGESALSVAGVAGPQGTSRALTILLVNAGADFGAANPDLGYRLGQAIDSNDLELLLSYLDHGAAATTKDNPYSHETLLGHAILRGRSAIVSLLLEKGADVNGGSDYGSDLSLACVLEDTATIAQFIGRKADVNAKKVATPLWFTLADGNDAALADLIMHTTAPIADTAVRGRIVARLIGAGADVDEPGANGDTPLAKAAERGWVPVARALVEKGAKIETVDQYGATPLMRAGGSPQIIALLLAKGASVTAADNVGRTALMMAISAHDSSGAQALIAAGSSLTAKDQEGFTAVTYDVVLNSWETGTLRRLLDAGAEVDPRDSEKATPLILAAQGGHYDKVATLVEYHADVNAADNYGATALIMAVLNNQNPQALDIVNLLIAKGADVNARMTDGRTALGIAKTAHRQPFIDALTAAGGG